MKHFIEKQWDRKRPLLLGYSGGPDSKALLYALREIEGLPLHLAHVDHGWREESASEALALGEEAKRLGVPFHSVPLKKKPEKNWEEAGREGRLKFFRSLFDQIPFQALLLAHQADDRAETALKRVLEGAHLAYIGGLAPVTELEGMSVWRPLLGVRKREVVEFLRERELPPLIDPSNEDVRFLRTRLRQEAIPLLTKTFGKEIVENLSLLSERAFELQEYLDRKMEGVWGRRVQGPWGVAVQLEGLEKVEARHLVQRLGREGGIRLPRTLLEPIVESALEKAPQRRFRAGGRTFLVGRGWVALIFDERKKLNMKELLEF
ncbi:MAG: tRNA lysidine(34) synthetase TilS [Verrucomicrobiota bacterium]|nr:tRNA lysidine(34) synthetase TilS [Verrucomicrobiota bacterium]